MQIGGHEVLLPTTMVGSWPRPLWMRGGVLRESAYEVDYPDMFQRTLYEDAVRLCVKDQDLAGLDIVTDGNQYFQGETPYDKIQMLLVPLRLHGFRGYGPPGPAAGMEQYFQPVVHDKVRWVRPVLGPVLAAVKLATDKPFKININAGPAAVAGWCQDEYYGDPSALRADIADAFNRELRWLAEHGAPCIQLTEQTYLASGGREEWVLEMMERVAHRVPADLVWHMCYGNAREFDCAYPEVNAQCLGKLFSSGRELGWQEIHLETARPGMGEVELLGGWLDREGTRLGIGVVEVMSPRVETAEQVATRIRLALEHLPAERLVISTDCGLYQLPRDLAFRKLRALVAGTRLVRRELGATPAGHHS
jgi:5-methyltetrahydropteroyltriglutamate--homocysteine methyltransferase